MTKQEKEFRKVFEKEYNEYLVIEDKTFYDYGEMETLELIAKKVFEIDVEKLEKKLLKKFEKNYWHHIIYIV